MRSASIPEEESYHEARQLDFSDGDHDKIEVATPRPLRNSAFIFVKPHACNDIVKDHLLQKLTAAGMMVRHEIDISGRHMDTIIDQHYYAISQKAVTLTPSKLQNVPTNNFYKFFGETWAGALANNTLLNAKEASEKLELTAEELYQIWKQAESAGKICKMGGGFYVGMLIASDDKTYYVVNGFYLRLKEQFTSPSSMVHGVEVEWDPADMSWKEFRQNFLGCTDPKKAAPNSLRRDLYDRFQEFCLSQEPNVSDNCVHASASPLEALSEKHNWLGGASAQSTSLTASGTKWTIRRDPFGRALISQGLTEHLLTQEFFLDPVVTLPGGTQKMSLFDAVEDTNTQECLDLLVAVYDLQLEQAKKADESSCSCILL